MKTFQQSCTITFSTGATANMTGIFEERPAVSREMIAVGVKYREIVWHKPQEIVCKSCRRQIRQRRKIQGRKKC